MDCSDVVG
jgi:hypothetical protein